LQVVFLCSLLSIAGCVNHAHCVKWAPGPGMAIPSTQCTSGPRYRICTTHTIYEPICLESVCDNGYSGNEKGKCVKRSPGNCPDNIRPYIEGLRNTDAFIRAGSAAALGQLLDPCAVVPLIETLKDTDAGVRQSCVAALRKITNNDFGEDIAKWQAWWSQPRKHQENEKK
jgi:hypothetical protein